jgi:nucleotide-binding universal stress UspA family protein
LKRSIFTSIAEFANSNDANLVVMGTHGMKGMQKLTGSWALKVIVKSKVPFIVVQEPPADQNRYHNIVFPIDFRVENKEKMGMAIFMGKYFDSKVHILKTSTNDKALKTKINRNLNFAVKYLIQNNVEYEIHDVSHGKLAQHTIDFAQKINADLILIVTTKNITFADYMLGASEQYIIANSSKIPVCCVNPKSSLPLPGLWAGGGIGIPLFCLLVSTLRRQFLSSLSWQVNRPPITQDSLVSAELGTMTIEPFL